MTNKVTNWLFSQYTVIGLVIVTSLITIGVYFLFIEPQRNHNPLFEQQMVKALNLKKVYSSSLFRSSWLKIFQDTIVGFESGNSPDSCYYFIKDLKRVSHISYIPAKKLVKPCENCTFCSECIADIDEFKNGFIYTAKFGGSTIFKIGKDSTIAQYFIKYRTFISYANKILLFKKKIIIISYSGIYVFDIISQNLIWQYKYELDNGLSAIVGNKLAFAYIDEKDRKHIKTYLVGVDLDELKVIWIKGFKGAFSGDGKSDDIGQPFHELNHMGNDIRFSGDSGISVIDVNTGFVKHRYKFWASEYILDSTRFYGSFKTLRCYDLKTLKEIWKLAGVDISYQYKSNIIAKSVDKRYYVIVDMSTGKVKAKIANTNIKDLPFRVINNYILFDGKDLYQ